MAGLRWGIHFYKLKGWLKLNPSVTFFTILAKTKTVVCPLVLPLVVVIMVLIFNLAK